MTFPKRIALSTAVVAVTLIGLKMLVLREPGSVSADVAPDVIRLPGVVRDFRSDHPDFDLSSSAAGHCVQNVEPSLDGRRRPVHTRRGIGVAEQWYDKDSNPIRPYLTGRGLPGGHFDVDVFDEATDKQLYHKHQFDDTYDVTYVDIVGDPKLLFAEIIGPAYPNELRLELLNPHHSSGTYTLEAGGILQTGRARDGFETTFEPSTLTQCRFDFTSLLDLRRTSPGDAQKDIVDRDDSMSVRMYDTASGELVYELAVYHHTSSDAPPSGDGGTYKGKDSCDRDIEDDLGTFDNWCDGAVTDTASFDQWYNDVLGTNLSTAHSIELRRNDSGVYEYLTDEFYPIDGRLFGNEGDAHNNFFTYAISATFTYEACSDWFFEFEGNDDAWVFIDGNMVIDLGGLGTPERQFVALDRLGLVDGQRYRFNFFFGHRRDSIDSVFRMRTTIPLVPGRRIPVSGSYD